MRLPRHLSVAIVAASESAARDLERSLRDDLGMNFRDTRYSSRGDLLQRFYVHFTTPIEAKGLEFDAVIIANVQQFDLAQPEEAHGCYVAFSRPRSALSVIGDASAIDPRLLQLLTSELVERALLMDGIVEPAGD